MGVAELQRRPLVDKFLHGAIVPANNYKCTIFQLSEIKRVSLNVMCGLLPPPPAVPRMLKLLCVLQVLARSNSLPNFSIVSLCIMQLCEYVLPIGIPLHVPKMGFLGVLRVKMWKYCVLTPKRHYRAWIRVCWCIAFQNRFNSLSSRSVERFCIQRNRKNWVATLAIWGEVTPGRSWQNATCWEIR